MKIKDNSLAADRRQTKYRLLSSPLKSGISSFIFLYLLNLLLDNAAKICIFFKKKVMGEGIK